MYWNLMLSFVNFVMPQMPKIGSCKGGINLCHIIAAAVYLLYGGEVWATQTCLHTPAIPGRCSRGLSGPKLHTPGNPSIGNAYGVHVAAPAPHEIGHAPTPREVLAAVIGLWGKVRGEN